MKSLIVTVTLGVVLASGCSSREVTRPETGSGSPSPVSAHTWVAIAPIQCLGNPWEQAWVESHGGDPRAYPRDSTAQAEIIESYYDGEGIEINDLRSEAWPGGVCYACWCRAGYTLYLLVDDEDVPAMVARGYRVASPA